MSAVPEACFIIYNTFHNIIKDLNIDFCVIKCEDI